MKDFFKFVEIYKLEFTAVYGKADKNMPGH